MKKYFLDKYLLKSKKIDKQESRIYNQKLIILSGIIDYRNGKKFM